LVVGRSAAAFLVWLLPLLTVNVTAKSVGKGRADVDGSSKEK